MKSIIGQGGRAELRPDWLRQNDMNDREVQELAAILVEEHGGRAVEVAERRQAEYADRPGSEVSLLWAAIRAAAAQLLRRRKRMKRAG